MRARGAFGGILASILVACAAVTPRPGVPPELPPGAFPHVALDAVLASRVDAHGRVDYAGLVREPEPLETYLAQVAATSPDSDPERFPDDAHRLAYWVNAYNAWVLKLVKDHYPVASVTDVPTPPGLFFVPGKVRFFLFQRVPVGGAPTSLYGLENGIVRRRFADPRVHFALNCASLGCPRLPAHAFHPETLDAELEAEARRFVADSRNVRIDDAARTIWLSALFDWYEDDFTHWVSSVSGGSEHSLVEAVARWSEPGRAETLRARVASHRVAFLPYDWALNDQASAPPEAR